MTISPEDININVMAEYPFNNVGFNPEEIDEKGQDISEEKEPEQLQLTEVVEEVKEEEE